MDYFYKTKGFNGVFSRNNLLKLKKGAYVINLDRSKNTGTHWTVIFLKNNEVIYFASFGAEYIPKEIMDKIGNKNIKSNIFRIQDNNSMCGYFCILFIEYMLNNKTLTDYPNLFSPYDFKKNDEIIKRYFKQKMEIINLEDQSNYRLNEISKIKDYFNEEILYQQSLTNKLNKYLTVFDILNIILTVFLTVFSSTNIFAQIKNKKKVLGLITSIFSLIFSLIFGIIIKLKQEIKIKKKKHNKFFYSAKNKLDCI